MKIRPVFTLIAVTALIAIPRFASGQISIESWSLSSTEATFTISGSTSVGFEPDFLPTAIYIGAPGDNDWILSSLSNSSGSASGSINGYDASAASWGSYDDTAGDYLFFTNSSLGEYDFSSGGSINLVATVEGNFAPSNLNQEDLIISWGLNSNTVLPDVATQIGSFSAVPEPSTYAALFGVFALGFTAWRRRTRRA